MVWSIHLFEIITNEKTYNIKYDFKDFSISKDKLTIKIKDNLFSKNGLILNVVSNEIKVKRQVDLWKSYSN